MADLCTDNRFELIEKFKKKLIESTNIETSPEEMNVLDNILFRFWQMGWLDKLELPPAQPDVPDTNVGDMISRQAAINAADRADYTGLAVEDVKKVTDEVVKELKQLLSAQPQIIHCAECIHWKHSAVRKSYCEVFDWMSKAEDFCSFAERREE